MHLENTLRAFDSGPCRRAATFVCTPPCSALLRSATEERKALPPDDTTSVVPTDSFVERWIGYTYVTEVQLRCKKTLLT